MSKASGAVFKISLSLLTFDSTCCPARYSGIARWA